MTRRTPDQRPMSGDAAIGGHASLESLWEHVVRARAAVAAERHDPQHHSGHAARLALIDALEAYLAGIAERGHPTPYPLTNELRMQRLASVPTARPS